MIIYTLPCSGGKFPTQLAFLSELSLCKIKPDIVLGTSGGNVAAYTGLAAKWDPHSILRIGTSLSSEILVQSWWPNWCCDWIPSWIYGMTQGSVYRQSMMGIGFLGQIFDSTSIVETEIWTGTLNLTSGESEFFCNRSKEQSIIDSTLFREKIFSCKPLSYLNGNINDICDVSMASASIPVFTPPVKFNGNIYTDGGTRFASPLVPFLQMIRQFPTMHINYLNHKDFGNIIGDKEDYHNFSNMITMGQERTSDIITGNMILERSASIQCVGDMPLYYEFEGSIDTIKHIHEMRLSHRRSVLEVYPYHSLGCNLEKFNGDDVARVYFESLRKYRCRLWLSSE